MAAPRNLPIDPWPIDLSDCEVDIPNRDLLLAGVTDMLWAYSGRRWGTRTIRVRPCRVQCADWPIWWETVPHAWGGYRLVPMVHRCGVGECGCEHLSEIALERPVVEVVEVKIDGEVLDSSAYRVDNWSQLVRIDGEVWPSCQNMAAEDSEDDTWSVTYLKGRLVPMSAQLAASELACNLAKAAAGLDCDLPPNITSLTRQGISVSFASLADLLASGHTGMPYVDMWLRAVNPNRLMQAPRVMSPAQRRNRKVDT